MQRFSQRQKVGPENGRTGRREFARIDTIAAGEDVIGDREMDVGIVERKDEPTAA